MVYVAMFGSKRDVGVDADEECGSSAFVFAAEDGGAHVSSFCRNSEGRGISDVVVVGIGHGESSGAMLLFWYGSLLFCRC